MDKAKTLHASKVVTFSSLQVLSIAICFVTLIQVQIKLYEHDQILLTLLQQKEGNSDVRNTALNEAIGSSGLKIQFLRESDDKHSKEGEKQNRPEI